MGNNFPESHADGKVGGAVVEFRRTYEDVLMSGDPFQIMSGIVEVGPKVQSFAHLIFNLRTNTCCVNAQAVACAWILRLARPYLGRRSLEQAARAKNHATQSIILATDK